MTLTDVETHQRKHGFWTEKGYASAISKPDALRVPKRPNKTEAEFGRILESRRLKGEFISVRYEAAKLRIAGQCYFTPDWFCERPETSVHSQRPRYQKPIFFEVKGGHIWDDAKVKFRAASELHTWADFELWQKKKGEWRRVL